MFHINDKASRNILVSCDHGLMCVNRFDYNANRVGHGSALLDHGNVCTQEAHVCIDAIKHIEKPVIFDVGANIGAFTNWLARFFKSGTVHCFEPQRAVFQLLCANLAINNLHNVYTHNIALGEINSKIKILEPNYDIPADFGTFSLVNNTIENKTTSLIIDMYTIDAFLDAYEITKLDLLKIDVEGMDLSVLRGAEKSIRKYKPVIFVEYFDNNTNIRDDIEKFLSIYSYDISIVGSNILATSRTLS